MLRVVCKISDIGIGTTYLICILKNKNTVSKQMITEGYLAIVWEGHNIGEQKVEIKANTEWENKCYNILL